MSRQTGDMNAIRHFVAYTIHAIYENILLFVIALVMIFIVDYRLALYDCSHAHIYLYHYKTT